MQKIKQNKTTKKTSEKYNNWIVQATHTQRGYEG